MLCLGSVSSDKAGIKIYTEKSEYFVGELIRGKVVIEVYRPLSHNGVSLVYNCYMSVQKGLQFPFQSADTDGYLRDIFFQKHILIPKGELGIGMFEFPVTWQLNPGHAPTFTWKSTIVRVTWTYLIQVTMAIPSMVDSINYGVNMRIKPCAGPLQPVIVAESIRASSCCFDDQFGVYAMLPKNTYGPGECINFFLDFDTFGMNSDIKSVTMRLMRFVRIHGTKRFCGTLNRKRLDKQSFGRVKKQFKERLQVSLKIPQDVTGCPSIDTEAIECKYYIKVELTFGLCAKQSFKIHLKIAPL